MKEEISRNKTDYISPVAGEHSDSSWDGLLGGAGLSLDVKRIDMACLNNKTYDFEIEKSISLRQLHL